MIKRGASYYFSKTGTPPSSPTGGIDLRQQMTGIMYGDGFNKQQGHWVIYRRFDTSQKSQYYDDNYGESVGGPTWEYEDEVVITRRVQITAGSLTRFFEQEMAPGILHIDYQIFYFEHSVAPKLEDEIYEVTWEDHSVKPRIDQLDGKAIEKFNINSVVPLRGDNGRIEFYACLCRVENVRS